MVEMADKSSESGMPAELGKRFPWWLRSSIWFALGTTTTSVVWLFLILYFPSRSRDVPAILICAVFPVLSPLLFATWARFRAKNVEKWKAFGFLLPLACGLIYPLFAGTIVISADYSMRDSSGVSLVICVALLLVLAEVCVRLQQGLKLTKMGVKTTYLRLGLLAVGHMVALFLVAHWLDSLVNLERPQRHKSPFWEVRHLYYILQFGQLGLLGIWLGMGTCAWWWRIIGFVFGFFWFAGISKAINHTFSLDSLVTLSLLCIVILLLACRMFVARLELPDQQKPKPRLRRFQYSILHLMILTTVVAVLLKLRHFIWDIIEWMRPFDFYMRPGASIPIFAAPAIASIWAVLGKGRPLIRISIVLIVLPLMFYVWIFLYGLVFWENFQFHKFFSWYNISEFSFVTLTAAVISLSLLVVRSCGYRLVRVRWKKSKQDSDEPIEDGTDGTSD